MAELSVEDIAAMREQGDFAEYLRLLTGGTPKAAPPAAKVATPLNYGPLHRRGAWPAGTRAAGPSTCHPDCDCALTDPDQGGIA